MQLDALCVLLPRCPKFVYPKISDSESLIWLSGASVSKWDCDIPRVDRTLLLLMPMPLGCFDKAREERRII
jgi:hypothetical protein